MSKEYEVVVDSLADVPLNNKNQAIHVINVPISIGDEDYTDVTPDQFYDRQMQIDVMNRELIRQDKDPIRIQSASPSPTKIKKALEEILRRGKDAIYVATSSALTSAYLGGRGAVELIKESGKYSNQAIAIDGGSMSVLTYLLVRTAMHYCDSTDEFVRWVFQHRVDTAHFFVVSNLNALSSSGRVRQSELSSGRDILGTKPLLKFGFDGSGARGVSCEMRSDNSHRLFMRAAEIMRMNISPSTDECIVIHAQNPTGAMQLYETVLEVCPAISVEEGTSYRMSPATGVHLGYSAVGLAYIQRPHVDANAEFARSLQNSDELIYGYEL